MNSRITPERLTESLTRAHHHWQLRSAEELLEKTRRGLYKILAGENGEDHG